MAATAALRLPTQAWRDYERIRLLANGNFEAGAPLFAQELRAKGVADAQILTRLKLAAYENAQHHRLGYRDAETRAWAEGILADVSGETGAANARASQSSPTTPAAQSGQPPAATATAPAPGMVHATIEQPDGNRTHLTGAPEDVAATAAQLQATKTEAKTPEELVSQPAENRSRESIVVEPASQEPGAQRAVSSGGPPAADSTSATASEPSSQLGRPTAPDQRETAPRNASSVTPAAGRRHAAAPGSATNELPGPRAKIAESSAPTSARDPRSDLNPQERQTLADYSACLGKGYGDFARGTARHAAGLLDDGEDEKQVVARMAAACLYDASVQKYALDVSQALMRAEELVAHEGRRAGRARQAEETAATQGAADDSEQIADALAAVDADRPPLTELLTRTGFDGLPMSPTAEQANDVLRRLREQCEGMSAPDRSAARLDAARVLGEMGLSRARELVDSHFAPPGPAADHGQGQALAFETLEPATDPVDAAAMLAELVALLRRFVVMSEHAAVAVALWIVHSYLLDAAQTSPILAFISPQPRCGKTRTLNLLALVVHRPLESSSITPAALFRTIQHFRPTLLIDEMDTFARDNDELRGVLNSGHTRGGGVVRTVGDDHEPRRFSTFCPKAMASINRLPATLHDRSIVVELERRTRAERIERLRASRLFDELRELRAQLLRWSDDHRATLADADPDAPSELNDRATDGWRPLFAIADAAGGPWPSHARSAALELSADSPTADDVLIVLLHDLRDLFDSRGVDRLGTKDMVDALVALPERPWSEWGRPPKAITANKLASLLRRFKIHSKDLRIGERGGQKGYERAAFTDVWARYSKRPFLDDAREEVE